MWELCENSSQYLVDLWGGHDDVSWQKAKAHFKEKGYWGDFILIKRTRSDSFKLWNIEIPSPRHEADAKGA